MGFSARHQPSGIAASHRAARGRGAGPTGLDVARGAGRPGPASPLPVEIGFLAAQGVDPDLLLAAAAEARRAGVSADRALLGLGFPADRFYALLAGHLGAPFLDHLPPLDPDDLGEGLSDAGVKRLASGATGVDRVMAPVGRGIAAILRAVPPGGARGLRFAITSRRRLETATRRHTERTVAKAASEGLARWDDTLSARGGLTRRQRGIAAASCAAALLGFAFWPSVALALTGLAFSALFAAFVVLRLMAVSVEMSRKPAQPAPVPDHLLPVYTIIVPLFREARVVDQLLTAIDALDYPRAKIDAKILLEAGDDETLAAVRAADPVGRFDVIVAPPGKPRTKPRALNIGLAHARGDFVTVYDAEDIPDPGQLRAAVARFYSRPETVACLQAQLAISHARDNWLTGMFRLEYAALFGVIKPGLTALGAPMPLGGTSNHFRTAILRRVGGWDAWNVTEDIDLGFRLARKGYRVEALDSVTAEEAPLTVQRWLPQRIRWLKGWIITGLVHTRRPGRLVSELGFRNAAALIILSLGTVASCLLWPVFAVWAAVAAWDGSWFHPVTTLGALWSAWSCLLLLAGAASLGLPLAVACKRQRRADLLAGGVGLPIYLLLISWAALWAVVETIKAPHHWNKTEHGLAVRTAVVIGRDRPPPPRRRALVPENTRSKRFDAPGRWFAAVFERGARHVEPAACPDLLLLGPRSSGILPWTTLDLNAITALAT
ncbi:MAG: glycosyltransferase [Actinomycetospora chiangmaiensis]|nr:glycosyltransferase [Actinomycetospora chiangmaiensis]